MKIRLFALTLILLPAAVPAVWSRQEINLELETYPAPRATERAPQQPIEEVKLPTRIEAISRGKSPGITGASAILVDAETGQVLYQKNAFVRRPVASTTKIMTAIVALERSRLNDIVVASKNACRAPHTSLHLKPGERVPMLGMLTAMLLRSANDAAVAVAEHVAGSIPAFARLMNKKAKEIGAKRTRFKNPNGLYVSGHYSTAYDLALITRYALQIPEFNEIVGMRKAAITRSLDSKDVVVFNRSPFVKVYRGADGVKSGYTREAGNCFVGSATRDGWRLISVVLKSKNANKDTAILMDYGFSNFRRVVIVPRGRVFRSSRVTGAVNVPTVAIQTLQVGVPRRCGKVELVTRTHFRQARLPVKRGQILGDVTAYMDGVPVAAVALIATRDIEQTVYGTLCFWTGNGLILLICLGLCAKYAGAASKNTRRGWHRLSAEVRRADHFM